MVALLLNVGVNETFKKVNTYSNYFDDVKDINLFAENVKTANELGIMNGKTDTTFVPYGN